MKKLLSLFFILLISFSTFAQDIINTDHLTFQLLKGESNFYEICDSIEDIIDAYEIANNQQSPSLLPTATTNNDYDYSEENIRKDFDRWYDSYKNQLDASGQLVGQAFASSLLSTNLESICEDPINTDMKWVPLGPFESSGSEADNTNEWFECIPNRTLPGRYDQLQGRIISVGVHPTDENFILIGTQSGGIFKTIDGGQNWYNVTDDEDVSYYGANDFAFHPTNPEIIYAVTGNSKTSPNIGIGRGVMVSSDFGENWELMSGAGSDHSPDNFWNSEIVYLSQLIDIEISSNSDNSK